MTGRPFFLAALFSAGFWVFAGGMLGEYHAGWSILCLVLAATCLLFERERARWELPLSWRGLLLVAGILALVVFPMPLCAGGVLLPLAALGGRRGVPPRLARAARDLGLLLVLQVGVWMLCEVLFSRLHHFPQLAPWLAAALRTFGEDAIVTAGKVSLTTSSGPVMLRPTFESLHAVFFALFWVGLLFGYSRSGNLGAYRVLMSALIVCAFAVVRLVFNILVVLNTEQFATLYSPWLLVLSALPVVLLLPAGRSGSSRPADAAPRPMAPWIGAACALFLIAFVGLSRPGHTKQGRVLINEHNSDWEMTTRPFDTHWYGMRAGYNYYCFADLLSRYFDVSVQHEPIDDDALAAVDVLILKTPTAEYATEEVDSVERFVRSGGSLFLIGDHTNVFGSSQYLNQIGERFDFLFNSDSQHRIDGPGLTLYEPPRRLAHPVVRDMPPFLFGTGCTLAPPLLAEDMIIGRANLTQRADYASSNFFLTGRGQLDHGFGFVSQAAGLTQDRGRLLAFSDSTVFSNFWMYVPGKPELLLGMMNWLNRTNGSLPVRRVALFGLLASVLLALMVGRRARARTVMLGFAVALPLVTVACDAANRRFFVAPAPRSPVPEVLFCRQGTDYFLPRTSMMPDGQLDMGLSYVNLYSLPVRVGLVPREFETLEECLARDPGVLVLVNPTESLPESDLGRLIAHVERGGRLLVLLRADADPSSGRQLLRVFDLDLEPESVTAEEILFAAGGEVALDAGASFHPLRGGQVLLRSENDEPCCVATQRGDGCAVFLSCGELLSDAGLGHDSQVPSEQALLAYRTCFWLFEGLSRLKPGASLPVPDSMQHYFGEDPLERIEEQLRRR